MKKCLILILCFALIVAFGCSANAVDAAITPGSEYTTPAPLGGDSTVNGERNVTDGRWLYYFDSSKSCLYRVDATLENAERIFEGTCSHISLVGDEVWLWDDISQLQHVAANGTEPVGSRTGGDIAASWYYEGSLYYLGAPDFDVYALKRLDLNSMELTDLNQKIIGTYPSLVVSAGHIFFTDGIDETSRAEELYRIDLDGTNRVKISDHAFGLQLVEDKLYYRNEDGLWVHNVVNGRTKRVRDDPGETFWISDGMLYYNNYAGESTQLVCTPLYGSEKTVLFPGHVASTFLVVWNGVMYFDEYNLKGDEQRKYYIGTLADKEAILWYQTTVPRYDDSNIRMPNNPFTKQDTLAEGTSWLYLEASATLSACYRLYDTNGTLVQQVLLRPNESKTISFPSGYYVLKIAEGTNWINDDEAFGPDGEYSSTSNFGFEADSTYRIGSGNRGDFYGTDQSGF